MFNYVCYYKYNMLYRTSNNVTVVSIYIYILATEEGEPDQIVFVTVNIVCFLFLISNFQVFTLFFLIVIKALTRE